MTEQLIIAGCALAGALIGHLICAPRRGRFDPAPTIADTTPPTLAELDRGE